MRSDGLQNEPLTVFGQRGGGGGAKIYERFHAVNKTLGRDVAIVNVAERVAQGGCRGDVRGKRHGAERIAVSRELAVRASHKLS